MTFLVPEGPTEYWVDNWVIPADSEHPGGSAQVDRLRARPGRRGQGDELPPVPRAGRGDPGRRSGARERPP
jgi:hypothetical protein